MLRDVLNAHPEAAHIPDSRGHLPLHLSLKSGKTWQTGIYDICNASPQALLVPDKDCGLLPFMIAAFQKEEPQVSCQLFSGKLRENPRLTTIFELLRRDPSQLAKGFFSSDMEF